jgi:hypothetical protein
MAPNMAIMDWSVAEALRYSPKLLDLGFKYLSKGGLTNEGLAVAMGVQQILIANVMYNSAKEGQSDSLASVWGKHIVFAYAPSRRNLTRFLLVTEFSLKAKRHVRFTNKLTSILLDRA